MLEDLDRRLNTAGVSLVFAELKTPVRRKVERYELTGVIDPAHFFPTVTDAVDAYQEQTGATGDPPRPIASEHRTMIPVRRRTVT